MCIKKEEIATILDEHDKKHDYKIREIAYEVAVSQIKQLALHTKPSKETDERLKKLEAVIETIVEQNNTMQPILQGLHDAFVGGKILNKGFTFVAKFLTTVGVIYGAIILFKEWVKK